MTVQDIQSLIDLLDGPNSVTALSVTAADGSSVAAKRASASRPAATHHDTRSLEYDVTIIDVADDMPPMPPSSTGTIAAPLVGIFHSTVPPVEDGTLIRTGQIVGYIESMKLMSELIADIEGVVTEMLISDRQPVEYAQPLLRVMPSEE